MFVSKAWRGGGGRGGVKEGGFEVNVRKGSSRVGKEIDNLLRK